MGCYGNLVKYSYLTSSKHNIDIFKPAAAGLYIKRFIYLPYHYVQKSIQSSDGLNFSLF